MVIRSQARAVRGDHVGCEQRRAKSCLWRCKMRDPVRTAPAPNAHRVRRLAPAPVSNFAQTQGTRLDQSLSGIGLGKIAMQPFQGCEKLTPRELEVVELTLERLSSKEMARVLGISYRTVEVHRARIKSKLGIRKIADLPPDHSTGLIVNELPTPAP
jgi:DNA-binding CsgD family transcriptional regulator